MRRGRRCGGGAARGVGARASPSRRSRKLVTLWAALLRARSGADALRRYQERRLRRVLERAYAEVPLYRAKLRRRAASRPRDFRFARRPAPLPDPREGRGARPLSRRRARARHRPAPLPHPADLGLVRPLHGDRALAALRRRAQHLHPAHLRLARLPLVAHHRLPVPVPAALREQPRALPQRLARREAAGRPRDRSSSPRSAPWCSRPRRATCSSCSRA